MRIAFYAPLKPPDDPIPSGDRRVAQLFWEALRRAGHEPLLASRLRSYDGAGDLLRQARLARTARRAAKRLVHQWQREPCAAPRLWFTYHLYYKAPDWIGPAVAKALGIPYVVAEASLAMKRAAGPWALGHHAVSAALRYADLVLGLNPADREGVLPVLADPARWAMLAPFLDARRYVAAWHAPVAAPRLVTVAMMRPGDKLASYRLLGAVLTQLLDRSWTLEVIGDGPARSEVERALAPFGGRVSYAGALTEKEIAARLAAADLFVWPAINEAFGMALLEAQASGLPVVAGDCGGVGEIVANGETGLLAPTGDVNAFAGRVRQLIGDATRRAAMGAAARQKVLDIHDLPVAAGRLAALLDMFRQGRAA
jgi:glycosyltransferase involved in cell wall biosynthesis